MNRLAEDAVSGTYEEGKKELRRIGVRIWSTQKVIEKMGSGLAFTSKNLSDSDLPDQ